MTIECALVFATDGSTMLWHLPSGRSVVRIPDSRELWDFLWEHRHDPTLGGVAHTHPWDGPAVPSIEDVTTFSAIEMGLGRRLRWPILTFIDQVDYVWAGPKKHDYSEDPGRITIAEDDRLRYLSGRGW